MNSKRAHLLMLGVAGLLVILLLGAAYSSRGILTTRSTKLVDLKAKLQAYDQQQESLVRAKKDIETYNSLYAIAKVVVPENKNQAETVRQIVKLADDNSIYLGSITFPMSDLGNGPAGQAGAGPKTSLGNVPKTPLPTTGTSGTTIGSANLSQLKAVTGSPGVYVLQINVASDPNRTATYPQLISFLSALENNRLTAEVTGLNIVPDTNNVGHFSFSLSLNSYIKP